MSKSGCCSRGIFCTSMQSKTLRKLIEFNCYRSLVMMYLVIIEKFILRPFISSLNCCVRRDTRRDISWLQQLLLGLIAFSPISMIFISLLYLMVLFVLLLDLLSFPRFFLFRHRHLDFLESVIVAHPELDPAVVEEELVQKLQCLLNSLCRHPGVHCNLSASVVHQPKQGSNASFDADHFEIHFLKFAPETRP